MSAVQRFHSEWCDRMNGGPECNCEAGDDIPEVDSMSKESFTDQIVRLELMASGDPKWDLSDNDCAAIKALLDSHRAIQKELFAIRTDLRARLTDEENVKYPTTRDKIRFILMQFSGW